MKQLLSAIAMLISIAVYSQQANVWHFGNGAGLDFNGGSPVAISSSMSTDEGCASICDASGNPLFYTDGVTVYDGSGATVYSGLHGHSSSTQSAIIVPRPGTNQYYIFTMDRQVSGWQIAGSNGLKYSEVNVSGSVTMGAINQPLLAHSQTTEKVTATCHSNGTDYWVTTVKQNGEFVSYLVSNAGVGSPVVSSVTAIPVATSGTYFGDDRVGYMKFSPQGDKLALARRWSNSQSELFDFDPSTGMVTANNGVYHTGTVYGIEFSADGQYFYTTEGFSKVFQYNTSTFAKSAQLNPAVSGTSQRVGALQIGPDGNIYVCNGFESTNGSTIDQITNVNSSSPNYNDNFLSVAYGRLGLPDIVSCFVLTSDCELEERTALNYNEDNCHQWYFFDASTSGSGTQIISHTWTFGDGYSSNDPNPTHVYANAGTYTVCHKIVGFDGEECCTDENCFELTVWDCETPECHADPYFSMSLDPTSNCLYNFNGYAYNANRAVLAYVWDFGDGSTGLGEFVSHSYSSTDQYTVCLKVLLDDGDGGCCVFEYCETVDVKYACDLEIRGKTATQNSNSETSESSSDKIDQILKDNVQVYPNPTQNELKVDFNVLRKGSYSFRAIDLLGKQYNLGTNAEFYQGQQSKSLDTSNLPSGTYILLVEGEGERWTQKFQIVK